MRAPLYVNLNVDLQNKKNRRFYLQRLRLLILSSKISLFTLNKPGLIWIYDATKILLMILYEFNKKLNLKIFIVLRMQYKWLVINNINRQHFSKTKNNNRQHNNPQEVSFINFSLQSSFSPNHPIYFFLLDL